jgi:phosphocarrier protein HPr
VQNLHGSLGCSWQVHAVIFPKTTNQTVWQRVGHRLHFSGIIVAIGRNELSMTDTAKGKSKSASDADCTIRRTFVMENFHGLHARPADLLIKCVSQYRCEVIAQCGEGLTDARSLLGLLGLAAGWQSKITFTATGVDAAQAIAAIQRIFERKFDEAYKQ